jgi:hypothetical protein
MIFLEAPKLWPACVAPLFVPACKPMIASPALNCCSENSRLFSSEGLGPNQGPLHSGCLYAVRPMAKIVMVTAAMFFWSHKSVLWKRSTSGTPYFTHAFWNLKARNQLYSYRASSSVCGQPISSLFYNPNTRFTDCTS